MGIVERGSAREGASGHWWWTLASLALLLAWDAAGLDVPLARLVGGAHGFPLRDHWAVTTLLHHGARDLAWLAAAWLLAGVWWPTGVLRRLARAGRVQWLVTVLVSVVLVNLLKYASQTSCPWDLAEFGGVARHISHWAWGQVDGGPGRCFPAGHASAGFAFMGGYFVLRRAAPRAAVLLLVIALAAGLTLGVAQQLRGAHFMSHTLWTAWLCWVVAIAIDATFRFSRYLNKGILPSHEIS
jgi:membrane-associated PAP2 superfamily phosphatase